MADESPSTSAVCTVCWDCSCTAALRYLDDVDAYLTVRRKNGSVTPDMAQKCEEEVDSSKLEML